MAPSVAWVVLGQLLSCAAADGLRKPRHHHDNPWKHMAVQHDGASPRPIIGNPWADQHMQEQHAQYTEKQVDEEVEKERPVAPKEVLPLQNTHSLVAHYAQHDAEEAFRAPAPGPAPGPGPAPWTEDPEWMVDGARGDKSQTVPIPESVTRGTEADGAPEQGFRGPPVRHGNLKTATDDWRLEFGPEGPGSAYAACRKHPENYWCKVHMGELGSGMEPSLPGAGPGGDAGGGGDNGGEAGDPFPRRPRVEDRRPGSSHRTAAMPATLGALLLAAFLA